MLGGRSKGISWRRSFVVGTSFMSAAKQVFEQQFGDRWATPRFKVHKWQFGISDCCDYLVACYFMHSRGTVLPTAAATGGPNRTEKKILKFSREEGNQQGGRKTVAVFPLRMSAGLCEYSANVKTENTILQLRRFC